MEEKKPDKDINVRSKLSDEAIVKALENCKNLVGCGQCTLWEDVRNGTHCRDLAIDLIHCLSSENADLKEERENMELEIFSLENLRHQEQAENERLWGSIERVKQQAVKDTAKEILQIIKDEYGYIGNLERIIKERYGVEVE